MLRTSTLSNKLSLSLMRLRNISDEFQKNTYIQAECAYDSEWRVLHCVGLHRIVNRNELDECVQSSVY